ncbi:hypothetical protein BHE74_00042518 [Ensete ventricosum]|nr:hypothetical protein BHE74_00042518 [Ensete ventricosum]
MSSVVLAARCASAGNGCQPCPPYLCQVGRMTADTPMTASGRLPRVGSTTLAGQLSGGTGTWRPVVRGHEDVAARYGWEVIRPTSWDMAKGRSLLDVRFMHSDRSRRSLPTIDDDDRVREPAPSTSGFGDEKNSEASHDSNGEEDDELRKRAEEFIEKMNGVWRAERKKMLR